MVLCGAEIRGERARGEEKSGAALLITGRSGMAPSELNVVPGWLPPAPQEGRALGSLLFHHPPPPRFLPLFVQAFQSISALFVQTNNLADITQD